MPDFDGGFKIESVTDVNGNALNYTINKTMMRIDMPSVLKAGQKGTFKKDMNSFPMDIASIALLSSFHGCVRITI